jgi:hypothetical protein
MVMTGIRSPLARSIIVGGVEGVISDTVAHIAGNVAFGDAWCHGVGEAAFSGLLAGGVGGGIGWWAYRHTKQIPRFLSNKALKLSQLDEAAIDRHLLPKGWQKGEQTGKGYEGQPKWVNTIDDVVHEIRLHPTATRHNQNIGRDKAAYHGPVSRYGIQVVPLEKMARRPVPGEILGLDTQAIYEMDAMLRLEYGDQPNVMPVWGLHYVDPFGFAYVDEIGHIVGVASDNGHMLGKNHPWLRQGGHP